MKDKLTILLVDDNEEFLASTSRILNRTFTVLVASGSEDAQKRAAEGIDSVILDVRLDENNPEDRGGLELLAWFRQNYPNIPVIMMTAVDDLSVAVEAMKCGASDFIVKARFHMEELKKAIQKAIENSLLIRRVVTLEKRLAILEPSDLIGSSSAMAEVRGLVDVIANDGECSVLIRGETGTGKELVARAIHKRGKRKKGAFIAVSVAALPKDLIAHELFGHEKGAFTGASERSVGYIEAADDGVLFLDEIGDIPADAQSALLRVLETREVVRVGDTRPIKVDFQLLVATNRDLQRAVSNGEFRSDLYFRLKNTLISIPRLTERSKDIPDLANYFLDIFHRAGRTTVKTISAEAITYLSSYSWPGNVRELRNCIESAMLSAKFGGDNVIQPAHLPIEVTNPSEEVFLPNENQGTAFSATGISVDKALARSELTYIRRALQATGGRVAEASKLLNYPDRFTLRRHVDQHLRRYPELEREFGGLRTNDHNQS
jgi:two-component system, NtrC family, response regulator AtoC